MGACVPQWVEFMEKPKNRIGRRQFLRKTAAGLAAPMVVPASVLGLGQTAPSERIGVGVIGLGSRGFSLLNAFLVSEESQVLAVCDVDARHYRDKDAGEGKAYGLQPAKETVNAFYARRFEKEHYRGVDAYADFREVCARDDIDAVAIATPDHWHALNTLEALRNGKDVYCEKPVTHLFHEGQAVYREVAKRKAVFQAGSQQRSEKRFRRAVELVRNGHLGNIERVEVGLPEGYAGPTGDTQVQDPPEGLDYDLWCGPSPRLPYIPARHHRMWRGHLAYGGGTIMDWIGHHNDIAHWALDLDKSGPTKVEAADWTIPDTDVFNAPQHFEIRCEYPGAIVSTISDRNAIGTKWFGEKGWLYVCRKGITASNEALAAEDFDPGPIKVYESTNHGKNFLACVKSRKPCAAPAETAHRSITPGHLGYASWALKRPLQWDAASETVVGDEEANTLLKGVDYRKPWTLDG